MATISNVSVITELRALQARMEVLPPSEQKKAVIECYNELFSKFALFQSDPQNTFVSLEEAAIIVEKIDNNNLLASVIDTYMQQKLSYEKDYTEVQGLLNTPHINQGNQQALEKLLLDLKIQQHHDESAKKIADKLLVTLKECLTVVENAYRTDPEKEFEAYAGVYVCASKEVNEAAKTVQTIIGSGYCVSGLLEQSICNLQGICNDVYKFMNELIIQQQQEIPFNLCNLQNAIFHTDTEYLNELYFKLTRAEKEAFIVSLGKTISKQLGLGLISQSIFSLSGTGTLVDKYNALEKIFGPQLEKIARMKQKLIDIKTETPVYVETPFKRALADLCALFPLLKDECSMDQFNIVTQKLSELKAQGEEQKFIANRPSFHLYHIHLAESPTLIRSDDSEYGHKVMVGIFPGTHQERRRAITRTVFELVLPKLRIALEEENLVEAQAIQELINQLDLHLKDFPFSDIRTPQNWNLATVKRLESQIKTFWKL